MRSQAVRSPSLCLQGPVIWIALNTRRRPKQVPPVQDQSTGVQGGRMDKRSFEIASKAQAEPHATDIGEH